MKFSFVVSALYLGSQLVLPTSLLSAAPQNGTATDSNSKTMSHSKANSAKQLTHEATLLLQQVEQAKQAVTAKQTQTAVSHINQAMSDRNQLATLSKAKGQSMIVPLYTELDDTSTLGPMLSAKKGKPQPNTNAPITVDDAAVQYTFVGLDLDKAKSRLEAAKTALHNNNPQAASDSLAAIGTDLEVETKDADLPLLAARENLGLAQTAVQKRQYKEANAALKEASIDVDKYSNQNSAQHAQEAKDLHGKIDSLSKTIEQDHSGAANTIQNWWHEVDSWFTHEIHS